jgi:AcrR family transcriptional regulator
MRVSAETKQATRQRILQAGRELFRSQGFEATTTRDIAKAASIAAGTLFNYFATKEAIVASLVQSAMEDAQRELADREEDSFSLEEALFAHVGAELRHMKPLRKYLAPLLETMLSPLASAASQGPGEALRLRHLEALTALLGRHGLHDSLPPTAWHLYWSLYVGVLAFWTEDSSPKQEDTLALLDDCVQMFVGWAQGQAGNAKPNAQPNPIARGRKSITE